MKYFLFVVTLFLISCSGNQPVDPEMEAESRIFPESYLLYKDFPSEIVIPRNVELWLPEKYEELEALPVLYMFDGQNIFHGKRGWGRDHDRGWQVDEVLDSLNRTGKVPEVIVVGIFNTGKMRISEYMPAKPVDLIQERIAKENGHWKEAYETYGIQSDEQLKFIVEELKPFIDSRYKTKPDRANTLIAGSSMGGLISAYAICEYPEIFGGAACFSTHWPALDGVFLEYLRNKLPDPATHKISFDFGTAGLDGEYEPYQLVADSLMEARGFEREVNWITRKYEGEGHNSRAWNKRFHIPMEFLLSEL